MKAKLGHWWPHGKGQDAMPLAYRSLTKPPSGGECVRRSRTCPAMGGPVKHRRLHGGRMRVYQLVLILNPVSGTFPFTLFNMIARSYDWPRFV